MSRSLSELLSHPPSTVAFSWSSALPQGPSSLTYGVLQQAVVQRAGTWRALGVCALQRILILDENPVEQILSALAAAHLRLVFTILPSVSEDQRQQIAQSLQPHYRCQQGNLVIDNLNCPLCPPSVAAIFYTSGTSGTPVGVMHSSDSLLTCAEGMVSYLMLSAKDRSALILPLSFHYGFSILSSTLLAGGEVYFTTFHFPFPLLQELSLRECTLLAGVPHFWTLLAKCLSEYPHPLQLRALVNAGDQCPTPTLHQLHSALPDTAIHLLYGSTEVLRSCHHRWTPSDKQGVIGRAVPHAQIALVDENNALHSSIGELVHWGPTVGIGYWNDAQSLCIKLPWIGSDDVYQTGDRMEVGSDGLLYFISRAEEIIKIAGRRISPQQIEHRLNQDHRVRESAVFVWNDDLTAVISVQQIEDLDDLLTKLHPSLRPKRVKLLLTPLPRTPRGKFSRLHVARQLFESPPNDPD